MSLMTIGMLFVTGVLLHNTEECLYLPQWAVRHGRRSVPPSNFFIAALLMSALLLAFGFGALYQGPQSVWAYLFCGYVLAMAANTLVPHVLASIATRSYSPGTATAMLFNFPLGIWFLVASVRSGFVQPPTIWWAAPSVAAGIALCVPVSFALAALLVRHLRVGCRSAT